MSFGPRFSAWRQRAMSSSSAVESGPPETARTRAGAWTRGANSAFASAAETGAASSAADTLLFSLDPLLHRRRRAREFAHHFAERPAGRLLLAERGERLPEAQKRIRCFGDGFVFGRDGEEGFRGVAVALALEHAFAQPIGSISDEPIIGIFAQEAAEGVFGEGVVLAQHIAVGEVVFVARGLRRRKRGKRAAASRPAARRLRRHGAVRRSHAREIKRCAGGASAESADRRLGCIGAHGWRCTRARRRTGPTDRAERVRRTRRVWILEGIERVAALAGRCHGRRIWRARLRPRPRRAVLLHSPDLGLELLVAKLQLLDRSGQLPNLRFEALEAHDEIGTRDLRGTIGGRGGALAGQPLTAAEKTE